MTDNELERSARRLICLLVAGISLFALACGGNGDGTSSPVRPGDSTGESGFNERGLTQRAQKCLDDFVSEDMDDAYTCYDGNFKDKCSLNEFAHLRDVAAGAYERFYEVEFDDIELRCG